MREPITEHLALFHSQDFQKRQSGYGSLLGGSIPNTGFYWRCYLEFSRTKVSKEVGYEALGLAYSWGGE